MRSSALRRACLATLSALLAGAAAPAADPGPEARDRPAAPYARCTDPTLRGEGGNVCRVACEGFFVDIRSGGTVSLPGGERAMARFSTRDGKLNGEGIFTAVTIVGGTSTACAFSGFDFTMTRGLVKASP